MNIHINHLAFADGKGPFADFEVARDVRAAQDMVISLSMEAAVLPSSAEAFAARVLDLLLDKTPWLGHDCRASILIGSRGSRKIDRCVCKDGHEESPADCCAVSSGYLDQALSGVGTDALFSPSFDGQARGRYIVPFALDGSATGTLLLEPPADHHENCRQLDFLREVGRVLAFGYRRRLGVKKTSQEAAEIAIYESRGKIYEDALNKHAIVSMTDELGIITFANNRFCEISGYTAEELIGNRHNLINSAHHDPSFFRQMWQSILSGQSWRGEICNRRKDGSLYWVDSTIIPFPGANGTPGSFVSIRFDITEQKRVQIHLNKRALVERIIAKLRSDFADGMASSKAIGQAIEAAKDVCGFTSAAYHALPEGTAMSRSAAHSHEGTDQAGNSALAAHANVAAIDPLGESFVIPIISTGSAIGTLTLQTGRDFDTRDLANIRLLCSAIGELVAAERNCEILRQIDREQSRKANTDLLTGLLSRRGFIAYIRTLKQRDARFAVFLIDIDRFKAINNLHGYGFGDNVLKICAQRIAGAVRNGKATTARLSGDEFALVVEIDADPSFPGRLAQRILKGIAEPAKVQDSALSLAASVGVAIFPDHAVDAEKILVHAESALRQAKTTPDRFVVFNSEIGQNVERRNGIEWALRAAIEHEEIAPFFQPIVRLSDRKVVAYEMLARWNDAKFKNIEPDYFVPLAEESGLIDRMFFSLLSQASQKLKASDHNISLAVNISAIQLRDNLFISNFMNAVHQLKFPLSRIEIEVTESSMLHDIDSARLVLSEFKKHGASISLDDFGTGFSSIQLVRELPFDTLKIDKSFISNMSKSIKDEIIVTSVISMARKIGISVTGEGIEDSTTASILEDMGCARGQGYLFGAASPSILP